MLNETLEFSILINKQRGLFKGEAVIEEGFKSLFTEVLAIYVFVYHFHNLLPFICIFRQDSSTFTFFDYRFCLIFLVNVIR